MKTARVYLLLQLTGIVFAAAASGQTQPTVASALDREISLIEKETVDAAEAMPEAKFNFTPESLKIPGSDYKGVRTFAGEVKHIAFSNYALWSPITGDKIPEAYAEDKLEKLTSKADIIRYLKDSFALGHKAAASMTAQNIVQTVGEGKSTPLYLATFGAAHAFNHYGQIAEYLRMNGIVPPASR